MEKLRQHKHLCVKLVALLVAYMAALPTTTVGAQVLQPTAYPGTVPTAYSGVYAGALPTTNWIQPAVPAGSAVAGTLPAGSLAPLAVPMQTTVATPLPTSSIPVSSLPTTIAPTTKTFTYTLPTGTYAPGYYPMPMQGSSQPLAMPMPTVPLQPQAPAPAAAMPTTTMTQTSQSPSPVATPVSTSIASQCMGTPTNTPVAQPGAHFVSEVATESFVLAGPPTTTAGSPIATGVPMVPMVPMQSMGSRQGNAVGAGTSEGVDEATVQTQSLKPQSSRKTKKARRRWICC
eukprot:s2560_g7.t1